MEKDLDFDDEEFVETEANENHLKGGLIALVVIGAICSLIILSIVLLSPSSNSDDLRNQKYEINELLNNEFIPKLLNGTWISGHELMFKELNGSLVVFNARNNSIQSIFVQNYITRQYDTQEFSLSADRDFVLLISKYKKTKNLVLTANFIIYDTRNGNIIQLEKLIETENKVSIEWADWAPIGNALVFINNNDIYYISYIGAKAKKITNTGKEGIVFNGIPDLLYRESISSKKSMLWWSKEGSSLCYTTIDNSGVGDNTIVFYGIADNTNESDSLQFVKYKYPKAQQIIPKTSLWVHNLETSVTNQIIPPKSVVNKDFYVTYGHWITNHSLTVVYTFKDQKYSIISTCSANDQWMCKEIIKISSALSLKQLSQSIVASNDGMTYFMISLRPDSLIGSYYQISSFRLDEQFIESFVTYGLYDVTKLLFYDHLSQSLYFEAKQSIIVEKQHIYSVNIKNKSFECISCQLPFTDCHYFEAVFSPTAEHFIVQCLGPDIPKVYSLKLGELKEWFELESNEVLKNKLQTKVELKEHIFTLISDNKKIHIKLLIPLGFDDEVVDKYPLIIEANNPENRLLTDKWSIGWSHYLVSKHEYIYCWVESDDQNRRHRKKTSNYDTINENIESLRIAINHIKEKMLFIDSKRMCIWGSNVGAFVAISSLTSNDILNCAVLVSPVLNFKLMDVVTYDHLFNVWNSKLESNGEINFSKLVLKHILILHGSADEKVSIQHSMQFIKQLITEYSRNGWNSVQPLHQLQIYPDSDNSMDTIRDHMYQRIQLFFEQLLSKPLQT